MSEEQLWKLGESVRQARESRKMTQEELGRRVGTSRATIGLLENGQIKFPKTVMLSAIAATVDKPVTYFLSEIGVSLPDSASSQLHWLSQQLDTGNLRRLIAIGHALLQEQLDQPPTAPQRAVRHAR